MRKFNFNFDSHFGFNLEKLVLVLGFAVLSFFIVLIAGFSYDIKFMTVFSRSIRAFFVAGLAAFAILGILSIQEKYFGIKDSDIKPPDEQPQQQDNRS